MTQDTPALLSPKHQRFVDEYLIDLNATQAFVRAGYSRRDPGHAVWRLMNDPAIRAAIDVGRQRLAEAFHMSAERVIAEYVKVAFASMRDYVEVREDGSLRFDFSRVPPDGWGVIEEVRVDDYEWKTRAVRGTRIRLRLASKLHALDSLARHLGLFADEADGAAPHTRNLAQELREARERMQSRGHDA